MASRIAEVIYKLRDVFTGPSKKIVDAYSKIRGASRQTRSAVTKDAGIMSGAISNAAAGIKSAFLGIATTFSGARLIGSIRETSQELDRLAKTARRLQIDPQTLAGLEFAAERSGIAVEKVSKALGTLQKRTGEAVQGVGAARNAFADLGINAEQFAQLDAEQQIILLADAFSKLESEERIAANASALFSKENGLLFSQLLREGGPAIQGLIDEYARYSTVTAESAAAAEKFEDALTNLGARIDGIKLEKLGPVIEALSEFADLTFNADLSQELLDEITVLERKASQSSFSSIFDFDLRSRDELNAALDAARKKLEDLVKARDDAAKQSQQRSQELSAAQQVESDYAAALEQVEDAFESQTKVQQAELKKQQAELRAARSAQVSIEQEFANLLSDVTKPKQEDVTLLDVFTKINEARRAGNNDNLDEAINLAREGGDLLLKLKEKGTETQGTLQFLGKELGKIATEASDQQVQAELVDVEQAQQGIEAIKTKFAEVPAFAAQFGKEAGAAFAEAMQAEISNMQITLPTPTSTGTAPRDRIFQSGNSFSDRQLQDEITKRGSR